MTIGSLNKETKGDNSEISIFIPTPNFASFRFVQQADRSENLV